MKAVHEHKIYLDAVEIRKAIHEYLKNIRDDIPDNDSDIELRDSDGMSAHQEVTVVWTEREPK